MHLARGRGGQTLSGVAAARVRSLRRFRRRSRAFRFARTRSCCPMVVTMPERAGNVKARPAGKMDVDAYRPAWQAVRP